MVKIVLDTMTIFQEKEKYFALQFYKEYQKISFQELHLHQEDNKGYQNYLLSPKHIKIRYHKLNN